jgi:subtilisin-like proprotein convertase family protein
MLTRRFTCGIALMLIISLALPVTAVVAQPAVAQTAAQAVHAEKSKTKTVTKTFTNSGPIAIPGTGGQGVGTPYPSTIQVSGLKKGKILDVNVTLNSLSHTFPDDIDVLLAATQIPGVNATIMSDVGGNADITNVTLVLDDAAPTQLPTGGPLVSGTFQPINFGDLMDGFPAPAPTQLGGSSLAVFNNANPNGTWQLFVFDDNAGNTGTLAGGWALTIKAQVKAKHKKHHHRHHR